MSIGDEVKEEAEDDPYGGGEASEEVVAEDDPYGGGEEVKRRRLK